MTLKAFTNQLIVIAGCQRSGTTLTGQILGAHEKCFLLDETDKFYLWFDAFVAGDKEHYKQLNESISHAAGKYLDHRNQFRSIEDLSGYDIVLKAPNLSFHYHELSMIHPKPIIIYPVRDVRGVVASMLKFKKMNPRQTDFFSNNNFIEKNYPNELKLLKSTSVADHCKSAIIWKIKSMLYLKFEDCGLNPFVFKYENLVHHQQQLCLKMAEHCGLEFEPNMLAYYRVLAGKGPGKTLRSRKIDDVSMSKWKNDLTPNQVKDVMAIAAAVNLHFSKALAH